MKIDHSDEIGFPSAPTPVRQDSTRIFPRLMRQETRLDQAEADRKWREANRERRNKAEAERMRRLYWERKARQS